MAVKYFEDLEIWKSARELANRIYKITGDGGFSKDFGLRDQIRRASVSVMSNISEGFERGGNQEFTQFLSIAKGSSGEVRSQLYVAVDQNYLAKEEGVKIIDEFKRLSIMINNFMEYLKGSGYKGTKYKKPPIKTMREEVEGLVKDFRKTV
ncbi:MAG: four helix bundle protein [Nitrospirota bacterium]